MEASAYEQYMLELVNAARASAGVQPLAMNGYINAAAQSHTDWQLSVNKLTHTGAGGTTAYTRMVDAGFAFRGSSTWGENVGWVGVMGNDGYQDDVLAVHTRLMNSSGHRANLLNAGFREIGIGIGTGFYQGYNSILAGQDFAKATGDAFLTGVAFADKDADSAYDVGEGIGGVKLVAVNSATGAIHMAYGGAAGGYSLQLPPGSYSYTLSAAGYGSKAGTVTIGTSNLKVDWLGTTSTAAALAAGATVAGTASADALAGTLGSDMLSGYGGNDKLDGRGGGDSLVGGTGDDIYYVSDTRDVVTELAGEGSDTVYSRIASYTLPSHVEILYLDGSTSAWEGIGNSADNKLYGNALDNRLVGGAGNDTLNGQAGADTLIGGTGNDFYHVASSGDVVVELAGEGIDTVSSSISYTLAANVEKLTLTGSSGLSGTGNGLANTLTGNTGANALSGGGGDDTLIGNAGNDRLDGGDGADILQGGTGLDMLTGGAGADLFDWNAASHVGKGSTRDVVTDFTPGTDKLDLGGIDAISTTASRNDAFSFIGSAAFGGVAGELRFERVDGTTSYTLVQGDTNGDRIADFEIRLDGQLPDLTAGDFVL